MKYLCLFILIFFAWSMPAQTDSLVSKCKDISEIEQNRWLKLQSQLGSIALNNYNLVYHRCYWEIDPAVHYIKGSITTYFKPSTSGFNQIEFDLKDNMNVDSVVYHSALMPFAKKAGDILQITLPSALPVNIVDSIQVYYQGKPISEGFGSFVQSEHEGAPIVWTLSEPFGAKTWWPCKQALSDKIDSIDILVKTPQGNRAASNGLLVSETVLGSDKLYHWKSRYPIAAYLVAIAVTNYTYYSDYVPLQTSTLQVLNYVYPESFSSAKTLTHKIVDIIRLFDSLLIEYPFAKEKYGHAQFGWGGGEEHQTMSFMVGFGASLMGHECAHQWFGDHITCGSWEDIWLNEGFASYFEWLITERYEHDGWVNGLPSIVKNITSQPDGSVRCDDTTQVSRIFSSRLSYAKGAFLLRMLRWKLGDQVFFAALKNYLQDPALKGKYAKTPQLIAHFNAASGKDLSGFFDQWYYKQGHPSYKVFWTQTGSEVSFTITQTQSHPSVSFFEMPVPLKFVGQNRDTTIVFDNTYSGQSMSFNISFQVSRLFFDPDLQLLSAKNSVIRLKDLSQLYLYPNPARESVHIFGIPMGTVCQNMSITDMLGRKVYNNSSASVIKDELQVYTGFLPKGAYIISLNTDAGKSHLRFVKE